MIAVDTNLLVYAHREDSPWHEAAYAAIAELAEGRGAWAIPWPAIHEFLAIVTHPRIFAPATPLARALDQVEAWLEAPSLTLLGESAGYWPALRETLRTGRVVGPQVHDARIAALCIDHGVRELWSADRDFSRFGKLRVRNPLV
ncbi:MAG TPA: TA system VapC family ribonuclease toxin [Thermoanaerobaculia bacterium]